MKYICLGYIEPGKFESLPDAERNAAMDECFTYDDELRAKGHFVGGEALQAAETAATLRWADGKVSITDGPYAETKEQLGGILILEARDMAEALEIAQMGPMADYGTVEVRPELNVAWQHEQQGR